MIRRASWSAALCAFVACSPKLSDAERSDLADCTKSLEAIRSADPPRRALLLAEGCGAEIRGFSDLTKVDPSQRLLVLARGTDFICKPDVGAAVANSGPDSKYLKLVQGCGRAYYGLAEGQEALLSVPWFVVQRVGAWIARTRPKAEAPLGKQLDAALERSRFPLALPDTSLPRARQADESRAESYLDVSAKSLRAGTLPVASLGPNGAVILPGYEGALVADDDALEARVRGLDQKYEELVAGDDGPDRRRAARRAEELAPPAKPAEPPAPQEEAAPEEGKMNHVERPRALGQYSLTRGSDARRSVDMPLLRADPETPAARILAVLRRLPRVGAEIAVLGDRAHVTAFVPPPADPATEEGRIELHVWLTDAGYHVWLSAGGVYELAKNGRYDTEGLDSLVTAKAADVATLWLVGVEGAATTQDLVDVLEVAATHKVTAVRVDDQQDPDRIGEGVIGPLNLGHGSGVGVGGGPRRAATTQVTIGQATSTPGLDKTVIRRFVRRHLPQLQYCYEKQLLLKKGLEGTVTAQFTISGEGVVVAAKASGVDPQVSSCVQDVLKTIAFPKPEGGATVTVSSYPLSFRPVGE